MNDGLTIALASVFVAGITVGPPLYLQAFRTRQIIVQAKDNAEKAATTAEKAAATAQTVQEAVGTKNGNGDLMQMAARALGENAEIFKQLLELYNYTHFNIHELYNAMTPMRGQLDILWERAGLPPMPRPERTMPPYTPLPEGIWRKINHQMEQTRKGTETDEES